MSGSNAINLGYNTSSYDPYFQQYMMTSQMINQQIAANAANNANMSALSATNAANAITTSANNSACKSTQQSTSSNDSHFLRNTAIVAAGAGLIIAGIAVKKGGGFEKGKILSNMKKGWNEMWKSATTATTKAKEAVSTTAKTIEKPKTLSATKRTVKGNTIQTCTIPDKVNYGSGTGAEGTIADQAKAIGLDTVSFTKNNVPKEATVKAYKYTVENGGKSYTMHVRNGELKRIVCDGNDIKSKLMQSADQADINLLETLQNTVPSDSSAATSLKDYAVELYRYKKDGIVANFRPNEKGTFELSQFASNQFSINSDAARAYAYEHPEAKSLFDAVKSNKTDGLKVASAEVYNSKGTFKIENGEIVGITETKNGKQIYYPSSDAHFIALKSENEKLFENVLNNTNQYKNVSYTI